VCEIMLRPSLIAWSAHPSHALAIMPLINVRHRDYGRLSSKVQILRIRI